jgi:hypothetical protein
MTEHSIKEGSVGSRQHLPPGSLGEQQRSRAVHVTLTLHQSQTQFPVGTEFGSGASKKRPLVTAREHDDAISLRVRRNRMMGLPRCPYVSTLAGTKVWPRCTWLACAWYLLL